MAYEDVPVWFAWIGDDLGSAVRYAVMDIDGEGVKLRDSDIPLQTDAVDLTSLATTYAYGSEHVGVGTNVTLTAGKVLKTEPGTVRLVHAQIYAKNGFNTLTANARAYAEGTAVNTKPFTALDKFLVCRYLENIGVDGFSETNMFEEVRAAKAAGADTAAVWRKYTLDPNKIDGDLDDIADGWELYVMFGTGREAKISPFNTEDGMKLAPGTGSQLKLVEEFDGGYWPTDPWSADTDRDGVIDWYAYQYHLKGQDAGEDLDGDGLSNYAEYLISEVFRYAKLDPENPKTDGYCVDYFRKMGDLYLGEIFTDHDQVDDGWEDAHATAANRYLYDPDRDDDNDGWSNYAEFRAGTDPSKITSIGYGANVKVEYPAPVINAKVVYNGKNVNLGAVYFEAWNEKTSADMLSAPDAIWKFGNAQSTAGEGETSEDATKTKFIGTKPSSVQTYVLGGGSLVKGSVKVQFVDPFIGTNGINATGWYLGAWDKNGQLVDYSGREVGAVDYDTGVTTVDFSKLVGPATGDTAPSGMSEPVLAFGTAIKQTWNSKSNEVFAVDSAEVRISWQAESVLLNPNGSYWLADTEEVAEGVKSHGHVREGLNTFICFADTVAADGKYTPGEPFGVVRGVDVGWQGAKFEVEITEASPITDRINLMSGEDDRSASYQGTLAAFINDRTLRDIPAIRDAADEEQRAALIAFYTEWISNRVQRTTVAETKSSRIRVVRYGIDDMFCYAAGVYESGDGRGFDQRVVMEKEFDMDGRDFLNEVDFLGPDSFDIDWGTMTGEIVDESGTPVDAVARAALDVTNMTYLVVVGDGPKDFRGSEDTNHVVTVAGVISRRFDRAWTAPRCEGVIGGGDLVPAGIVYTAHPTFVWSMPNESTWAKRFGSSYTAFKIRIFEKNGTDPIYDSGVVRAPVQDVKGRFVWTAPISVGEQTPQGKIFRNSAEYDWTVVMYNAKFQPGGEKPEDMAGGVFSTSVNTQQPQNDAGFSSIDATVKYTGPIAVLDGCTALMGDIVNGWGATIAATQGVVRVQAFTTADFSGVPAAETQVANRTALTDVTDVLANARLTGLAAGTYYLRAYIDMNGNFKKDEFESWGCAKEPVTVGPDVILTPAVSFYIEDADTNGNWYPDAWEYAHLYAWAKSWDEIKGSEAAELRPNGEIVLSSVVYNQLVNKLAGVSTGLSGSRVTVFQSTWFSELILDSYLDSHSTTTFDAIRKAVEKKVVDQTLKITAITLDTAKSRVILAIDAETDYANLAAGNFATRLYDLDAMGIKSTVTVKVYKKSTLAQEKWELVGEFEKSFDKGETEVTVDVKDGEGKIDATSGFYKVEVVQ